MDKSLWDSNILFLRSALRTHTLEVIRQTSIARSVEPELFYALNHRDATAAFANLNTLIASTTIAIGIIFLPGQESKLTRSRWLKACFGLMTTDYTKNNSLRSFRNILIHAEDGIDKAVLKAFTDRLANVQVEGRLYMNIGKFWDESHGALLSAYFDYDAQEFNLFDRSLSYPMLSAVLSDINSRAEDVFDERRIDELVTHSLGKIEAAEKYALEKWEKPMPHFK